MIDLFDIAIYRTGLSAMMSPTLTVLTRYVLVLPAAFLFSVGLSRLKLTAWTIGLGEAPWARARLAPKPQS
jgi:hypothetical protein